MIRTIEILGPATFAEPATLTTDKKINLIYGLNGTGKSTICRFLRSPQLKEFTQCTVLPKLPDAVYVYNDDFIRENFYESETLKGIFSLSKQNKDAELRIANAKEARSTLAASKQQTEARKSEKETTLQRVKQLAEDEIWKIKANFAGGDRVLEYCLDGLKGKKETLFNYLLSVPKPELKPNNDTEQLKSQVQALAGQDAQPTAALPILKLEADSLECDPVFETSVIGSQNSIVSDLIQRLRNSDWIREGLTYAESPSKPPSVCPFCQSETITQELLAEIRGFFDKRYEGSIELIKSHLASYKEALEKLPTIEHLKISPFASDRLLLSVGQLTELMKGNLARIEKKLQSPSSEVVLSSSSSLISEINAEIASINEKIGLHNERLRNKEKTLQVIKSEFWKLMRWDYDSVIARYRSDLDEVSAALIAIDIDIRAIDDSIRKTEVEIATAQKETINTDEAVGNINSALLELGIDDFAICKHDESLYRLRRANSNGSSKFSTLSEGEKMIITLLYFCELCKGRRSATDTTDEKVVVFDDPVSSLSHIYVFNVGQLLRSIFFQTNIASQIFVFTHSLYFFYELTDTKKDRREEHQALFRMTKSKGQSRVTKMKYEEIQNDYQAYWQIVNDTDQHPALIANCMRNIVDYFFNFVEKLDFNNVFQQPALRANKFQSFSRYMNRESHSLGQNIYDLKEFDYGVFREGLRLVFEGCGYGDHYKKMSSI